MKPNKRLLQICAMIISINMVLGCMSATASASLRDRLGASEPTEQSDEEPADPDDRDDRDEEEGEDPVDPDDEDIPDPDADPDEDSDEDADEATEEDTDEDTDEDEDEDEDEPGFILRADGTAEVSTYEGLVEALARVTFGGTIILTDDIDTEAMIEITRGMNVIIDLNGCTLNRGLSSPNADGHVIIVNAGGTLTIRDTSSDHSGLITGGYANNGGGINNKGNLYIEGGTISGNQINNANTGNHGAGIFNNSILVLSDCTISSNSGDDGGGIYNDTTGVITMTNVTISNNTSINHGGGGIDNYGFITILGGCNITGNNAASNGGGIWNNGTLRMSGCNTIANNTSARGTNNLYLKTDKTINVEGPMSGEIWISSEEPLQPVTRGWIDGEDIDIFHFDMGYHPRVIDGEVQPFEVYIERHWDTYRNCVISETAVLPSEACSIPGVNLTSGWYYVTGTQTFDDRLFIEPNSEVNIVLADGCRLNLTEGINVPSNSTLNIYGQENDSGVLIADAVNNYPAIGATNEYTTCGTISIYGGNITARGASRCAGIGTGNNYGTSNHPTPGAITIYGGSVNATGGEYGAGIGGSLDERGGSITIYAGTVTARGGTGGAGIGGGHYGASPNQIVIYGGTITANGGDGAAAIGEGFDPSDRFTSGTSITINGGTITANGGKSGAAGIGGGTGVNTSISITINGGTINAYSGSGSTDRGGAGIGAGSYTNVLSGGGDFRGVIIINDGIIHAEGSGEASGSSYSGGAGIGAGANGDMTGRIEIAGGVIDCIGHAGGAAIGAGSNTAFGYGDCTGTITITGGHTSLLDASYSGMSDHPQLVGHGADADLQGTLNLADNMNVWYTGLPIVPANQRTSVLRGNDGRLVFVSYLS